MTPSPSDPLLAPIGSVAVDAHPVHVAVAAYLVLSDDRHVVLDVAGRHAGAAPDAAREVNGHAPTVSNTVDGMLVPEVELTGGLLVEGVDLAVPVDVVVDVEADHPVPAGVAALGVGFSQVRVVSFTTESRPMMVWCNCVQASR